VIILRGMSAEPNATDDESGSRSGAGAYGDYLAEREEILRHKWVMSERQGYDAGFEAALMDWAHNHRAQWRRQRAKRGE
jgi:hypothetical protein